MMFLPQDPNITGPFPKSFFCLKCHLSRAEQVLAVHKLTSGSPSQREVALGVTPSMSSSRMNFYTDLLLIIHFVCLLSVLVLDESFAPRRVSAQKKFVGRINEADPK